MAEYVVEFLEAVEIDADNRDLFAPLGVAFDRFCQELVERRAVGQIGQGIVMGEIFDSCRTCLRSVTSSCVATQPPPGNGRFTT
jgi:hypothetical protein